MLADIEAACKVLSGIDTIKANRDRALILIGFLGAFRRSELAGLRWDQVEFADQGFTIKMGKTKTDQAGEENKRKVFRHRLPAYACPVAALKALQGMSKEYIFPVLDRFGKVSKKHQCLTGVAVAKIVKAHLGSEYKGHSLRAGFCTQADQNGATLPAIMKQTHHKTLSIVAGYAGRTDAWQGNAATEM